MERAYIEKLGQRKHGLHISKVEVDGPIVLERLLQFVREYRVQLSMFSAIIY